MRRLSQEELENLILEFISSRLQRSDDEVLDPEENLFSSGIVDSMGIMRLIAHLETTLDTKIPPRDLVPQNFRSVRVMSSYLEELAG